MARAKEAPGGWAHILRAVTVLALIMLLLAQSGEAAAQESTARQIFHLYSGVTRWAVPLFFMLWGMAALEEGRPLEKFFA